MLIVGVLGNLGQLNAQEKDKKSDEKTSIGGKEHNLEIYGVKIGMDVTSALQAVFTNANRKAGQEKPDAKKTEGVNGKDIRVVYKNLPQGELQIVFAQGKIVKEISLNYSTPYRYSDLRLPYTGDIRIALEGERYDDRYTLGYTDSQRIKALWWRDEKTDLGYDIRLVFTSGNRLKESQFQFQNITQKAITIKPEDLEKFLKTL
jgi:hypothetical protein